MKPTNFITTLLLATFLTGCSVSYNKTVSYDGFNKDGASKVVLHRGTKTPVANDICGSTDYALISQAKKKVIDGNEYDVYHCITKESMRFEDRDEADDYSDEVLRSEMDELF
ncbi:TPA: hypothetical protein ACPVZG_000088 [Vibrio parahaemolyticus]|nr:hypothetical protein [Vibrio parahaemolyticus]